MPRETSTNFEEVEEWLQHNSRVLKECAEEILGETAGKIQRQRELPGKGGSKKSGKREGRGKEA